MTRLELWGGLECTVNRTRDGYTDQSRLSGHHDRGADLDLFADLGIQALRYPVLWERVAPDGPGTEDWQWTDQRLGALRALGIRPIAGLVHHGSGPAHTDLLDDAFAPKLAAFAGQVAERYDWIEEWTPVNEPLTTARFTGLYGHWYPHHHDEGSFWRALINQIDGVRLAMKAVRQVNPRARLVQTDDLGRVYSTVRLAEQAAFENVRRWAGWDLLFGMVTPHHPLWARIGLHGLGDRLRRIADDPCPPDVIGVNHYLTSDRFLDHRLQRYDAATHGGNGRLAYADTEAVRVLDPAPEGLAGALRAAWQRYGVPIAITEVHNGCTREEQMRWAAEAWDTATALKAEAVDIQAVTAWSLLGAQGWNTLLTRPGLYETGVYDVSGGTPRPTALAPLWKGLPQAAARHPAMSGEGWWRRPQRIIYPTITRPAGLLAAAGNERAQPLLICGATGMLGQAVARACAARGIACVITTRDLLDVERPASMAAALRRWRPWAVINAAGWGRVDDAERDDAACFRANATGAIGLAQACADRGIGYLGFSSDLVFDGTAASAYRESDTPRPLNAFGRSQVAMEQGCVALPGVLVVRTAALFSPHDPNNFAAAVADSLSAAVPFAAAEDYIVSPTFVPHLADGAPDLLIDGAAGIWHLTNGEAASWAGFARRIAAACGFDERWVVPVAGASLNWVAPRPMAVPLISERGAPLPALDRAIEAFAGDYLATRLVRRCA